MGSAKGRSMVSSASEGDVGSTSSKGVWLCPFTNFHECKDDKPGSSGYNRLIAHFQQFHFKDDRKESLQGALSKDLELFSNVGETLRVLGYWLCGRCMKTHALSRGCHHPDGVFTFSRKSGPDEDFVVGIPRPQDPVMVVELRTPQGVMRDYPPSCRLAFAQALTGAIHKVVASPGTVESWVKLLLLPRCTLKVVKPSSRQERRSGNRKSLQCNSILRSLAVWKDGSGFEVLVNSLLSDTREGVVRGREAQREIAEEVSPNIKQCLRKVSDGHFTAAVKVLCSSGVAPRGESTMQALIDKHPFAPPPNLPSTPLSQPALSVDEDCVHRCVKSFPKGTSCG
ncbi:hypothetical protein Hanom_Chr09g00844251 [Helianthus anomalus]